MSTPKTLKLTLKRRWFDMIASGVKKEEYRTPGKWILSRLEGKEYDRIEFKNGYGPNVPTMEVEYLGWAYSFGKREWGGGGEQGEPFATIHLGRVLSVKNYTAPTPMSTPNKTAPDFGEPWLNELGDCEIYPRTGGNAIAYAEGAKTRDRVIACVNACAGMADPAAEIQALQDVAEAAQKCRHWHDCSYNPETGKTEGVIISADSFWELSEALAKLKTLA